MKTQINKRTTIIIAVLFVALIIIPLIRNDIGLARNPQNYMSQGWQEATQYLRNRLALEQEAKYYEIYEEGENFDMPYVLAWWDYGFWIVRDAHMPVICHPGGGKRTLVAQILLNENPEEAVAQLKELDIKYIIIDSQTAVEKFYSLVEYTGGDLSDYYESDYFVQRTRKYYETLLARLYILDNESQQFWGWHLEFNEESIKNHQIEGIDLVFESENKVVVWLGSSGKEIPEVKVFEVQ